jgi:ubiquinone/menaquinone biosynthesis C-methylase UbiE
LDRQVEPLGLAAMDVLCPAEGEHIVDIGCGCGQTSLALAARVRPSGSVVGVDISQPMLDVAFRRPRTADLQVTFRKRTRKPAISGTTFSMPRSLASA